MEYVKKILLGGHSEIWKAIIRPPRDDYKIEHLGPSKFMIGDKLYQRRDFFIYNSKGEKLFCSHWDISDEERQTEKTPCIIYLHGNSSSRQEAYSETTLVLSKGISLLAFDFSGCGKSEGKYLTLGHKEIYDLEAVVSYLINSRRVSKISLWGRSMGSVIAFKFCEEFEKNEKEKIIQCIIADSPFTNLVVLLKEIALEKVLIPKIFINRLVNYIRKNILNEAGFNISDIDSIKALNHVTCPVLFITGKTDDFIKSYHSHFLYDNYKHNKKFIMFDGDHNTSRPRHVRNEIINFIIETFTFGIEGEINIKYKKICVLTNDLKRRYFEFSQKFEDRCLENSGIDRIKLNLNRNDNQLNGRNQVNVSEKLFDYKDYLDESKSKSQFNNENILKEEDEEEEEEDNEDEEDEEDEDEWDEGEETIAFEEMKKIHTPKKENKEYIDIYDKEKEKEIIEKLKLMSSSIKNI